MLFKQTYKNCRGILRRYQPFTYTLLFFVFLLGVGGESAHTEDKLSLIAKQEFYHLNYNLDVSEEGDFWVNVRDSLRGGKTTRIKHTIDIYQANAFFGGHIARTQVEKYVRYNLFENTYYYGNTPEELIQTNDLETLKKFLFSLNNHAFVAVDKLETATLYTIKVRLNADDYLKIGFIPGLKQFFTRKQTWEFSHVAR